MFIFIIHFIGYYDMTLDNDKWVTVRLLRVLTDDVDEFLKTQKGGRFTSRPEFIRIAINELLKDYEIRNKH